MHSLETSKGRTLDVNLVDESICCFMGSYRFITSSMAASTVDITQNSKAIVSFISFSFLILLIIFFLLRVFNHLK